MSGKISRASLGTPARSNKSVIACAEACHHLTCSFLISLRCTVRPMLRKARNVFPTSKEPSLMRWEVRLVDLDKCGELAGLYQVLWRMTDHLIVAAHLYYVDDAPPVSGRSSKSEGVKCVVTLSVAFLRGSRGSRPRLGALLRSCAFVIRHSPGI